MREKSAGDGGISNGSLHVLHIHVLLVPPLGAGHMAQPGANQHENGVAIRETAHQPGAATDLPVQPFNDVIGTDAGLIFTWKIAVSQCFLNAVLHLLGGLFQLHRAQLLHHSFGFLPGRSFAFLGVDRLEHLCHQLYLGARRDREHIAVKVDGTALVLGFGEYFSHSLQHTEAFVSDHQFNPIQTTAMQLLEEADPTGLVLFHTLGGAKNLTVSYYSLLFSTHTKKGNSHPKRMIVSFFK